MTEAKYYLQYQGFSGTRKQIEKLEKQFTQDQIIRMAKEREFKSAG